MRLARILMELYLCTSVYIHRASCLVLSPVGYPCDSPEDIRTCNKFPGAICRSENDKDTGNVFRKCSCMKHFSPYMHDGGTRCSPLREVTIGEGSSECAITLDCKNYGPNAHCFPSEGRNSVEGYCRCAYGKIGQCGNVTIVEDVCLTVDCRDSKNDIICSRSIYGSVCSEQTGQCVCPPKRPYYIDGKCVGSPPSKPCKQKENCLHLTKGAWRCIDGICECEGLFNRPLPSFDVIFGHQLECRYPVPPRCPGPHICYPGDPCKGHSECGRGATCRNRRCECADGFVPTPSGCDPGYHRCCTKDSDCNAPGKNMFVCTEGSCACTPPKIWNSKKETCTDRVCFSRATINAIGLK